jgi:hypothetical protein
VSRLFDVGYGFRDFLGLKPASAVEPNDRNRHPLSPFCALGREVVLGGLLNASRETSSEVEAYHYADIPLVDPRIAMSADTLVQETPSKVLLQVVFVANVASELVRNESELFG